ncbi:hypothetical protein AB0D04_10260 [Streptomyces sp. NPDC048483]|uniref:hypothetical protein n=1 Tax=Streptomyces sp. NPDC048483 TaxID=3154927 RepID=UPI00343D71FE
MSTPTPLALYLARRDAYAEFLSAADQESSVCYWEAQGRYETPEAATSARDDAYAATRDACNRITVEPTGPQKEALALVEQLRHLGRTGANDQDWVSFKKAREVFVDACRMHLKETLDV